jgi:hypothetical protein
VHLYDEAEIKGGCSEVYGTRLFQVIEPRHNQSFGWLHKSLRGTGFIMHKVGPSRPLSSYATATHTKYRKREPDVVATQSFLAPQEMFWAIPRDATMKRFAKSIGSPNDWECF